MYAKKKSTGKKVRGKKKVRKKKKYGEIEYGKKKCRGKKVREKKVLEKKYAKKKYGDKKSGKPGCTCAHPSGMTSGSHGTCTTTIVQTVGKMTSQKEKRGGKMTSLPVTSDQDRFRSRD